MLLEEEEEEEEQKQDYQEEQQGEDQGSLECACRGEEYVLWIGEDFNKMGVEESAGRKWL